MKLLDILQEAITEYKVSYIVIKNKNVSKGSASYNDLADASKFFDTLTKDPEVYRAQIDKILGADSSRDMGGAQYMGGKEEIVSYSHPATKGRSQGGKKFDELTPAEQDIRTFANSRLDQQEKLGFTGDIGYSMNEGKDLYHVIVRDTGEIISDDDGPFDKSFAKRLAAKKKGWIIKKVDESVNEGMSKEALYSQIRDIIDSLDSGESDGIPLDNETEMLLQQELRRLRKIMKSMKEGKKKDTGIPDVNTDFSVGTDFSADLEEIYNSIK